MADDSSTTRLLGGRYRLVRPIGRGGMSDVHLARDERLGREVAVKLVHPERVDGTSGVDRLEREARLTAQLSHPNVVVVHDVIRDGDGAAIVMELVTGGTLADRLRQGGALPWREAVRITREVAAGLGAAHAAGLVHRDVKPSNVLLGPDDRVRVADFGIAAGGASTETTTLRGSIPYVAPEQARGDAIDSRTDVYALGCVLVAALTGQPPFDGGSGAATIGQHLHRPPPRPSDTVAEVPPALDAVVLRMLAKEPAERQPDMATVATELDAIARRGDDATVVLPPAPTVPSTPPPRVRGRRRWALPVGTLVVATVVAGGTWALTRGGGDDIATAAVPSPTPSASAPSTTSPSPTPHPEATSDAPPARPATIAEAATAFRRDLVAGRDDGAISQKAADDLDHRVSEIVSKDQEGKAKEVRKKAGELVNKVDELAEKGEITAPELADRLGAAAREFLRLAGSAE